MMERRPLVEEIQNYAQNIVDTVREPLLILDATLRVRSANRAFYQTFHVSPGETEGRLIYELGNGQWDIPDLRTLLEDIVPKSSVFDDFELDHTFPVIGRRVMLLNARKLQAGHHGELLVLAMEDVTARKRAEAALLEAGALQSAIFNSANFSSIATDEKGVIQIFNVGAERMLGYAAIEVMNKITPADISDPQEVIARAAALSLELATPITPGFEALVFKAARGIEDIYELTYIRKDDLAAEFLDLFDCRNLLGLVDLPDRRSLLGLVDLPERRRFVLPAAPGQDQRRQGRTQNVAHRTSPK